MRVLFLTHRLPYAPNRGDRARAFHMARILAPKVKLHVVSLVHDDGEAAEAKRLRDMGIDVSVFRTTPAAGYLRAALHLAGSRALTHCLLDAPGLSAELERISASTPPDVVLAYCSGMARFALEPCLATRPLVLDMVDVDSAKWAALGRSAAPPMCWIYRREARCLGAFEAIATRHAHSTLVVNERERDTLSALAPGAPVHVIGNGVDVEGLRPAAPPAEAPRVVFCGMMDYVPNVEGVLWFAEQVWPRIRASRPDAIFTIVGAQPTDAIRRLTSAGTGIEVTGTVPDVREHLWNSAVSVAPLLTARGVQNKVLEALAAGLPVVATSQVVDGIPPVVRPGCHIADTPESFADAVAGLLRMPGMQRRTVAAAANLEALTWEAQLAPVYSLLEKASLAHRAVRT